MSDDFARILTMLRQERKISQKEAAAALGISQALLSHYERGRRGCNLDFLLKVADYYNVSCDYLLGRSPEKTGAQITVDEIPDPDSIKDNVLRKGSKSSIVSVLNKKLIANSINVIYDILDECDNKQLTTETSNYLMVAVYKAFRCIYSSNPNNPQQLFSISQTAYLGYSNAAMQILEANMKTLLSGHDIETNAKISLEVPEMSAESLAEKQKLYTTSLLNVIQYAEGRMGLNKK